jgi:hypothetical protein
MATKLENMDLEIAHFRNILPHLPGMKKCCKKTIETLLQLGVLQVSTAFEHAIASVGGHTVISTDEADISDGSDGKLSSVRTSGYGKSYTAPVTNIFNKTGPLKVQVYERKQNKFYYFVIPKHAYAHIAKTSNIEIPFELDGTPRLIPSRTVKQNWWDYKVNSFAEMSA